jgi:uncharacterized protein (DUF736 family)|tara:strand:+ start:145 stop:345 length:201 start_codon:yes stop_codon:yes gene_type:complete
MSDKWEGSQWTKNQKGAIWAKQSKNGKFMSGYIKIGDTEHKIVIFPNKYKKSKDQPEFIVYEPFKN